MAKALLIASWLCCTAFVARAQDAVLSSHAAAFSPARSTAIKLSQLAVEHTFLPDAEAFRVNARFELQNTTNKEQRLQLGLFEPRCESESEEDAACDDPQLARFEHVETRVRGAAVPTRRARLFPQHEWAKTLTGVWAFELKLAAAESVPIEHRYEIDARPAPGSGMNAAFVARTGTLWAEPIDRASFTFLIPVRSCLVVEPEHLARKNRRVVLRDGEPWLQLSYGAQHWLPKSDVRLYFESCKPPRDTELAGCSMLDALARFAYPEGAVSDPTPLSRAETKAQLEQLDDAELQRCASAVFDAYASYFSAAELSALAQRPSAARHYTAPLLTAEDWQWVSLCDEVQRERRSKAANKPAAKPTAGCSAAAAEGGALPLLLLLLACRRGLRGQAINASSASSSRG
ncbi:MAG TPA: hypothetical protein VJR89_17670 [Polyangiales bacterium]|nr:hypothetical protein [Polyangiales bacterium]